jgi:tetratricopeptide (TPR) repeat protein
MDRQRRHQLLCEIEGYLDLVNLFVEHWPLSDVSRDRIVQRALEAIRDLEEAGETCGELLMLKGEALRTIGRYAEAIDPLSRAGDVLCDNMHVFLALAWCYKRIDRVDLAIEALEEALVIDPAKAILHYNLACYWSLFGNAPLAADFLAQAFELDSKYRDLVAGESDFDSIRHDPAFLAVTSVIV